MSRIVLATVLIFFALGAYAQIRLTEVASGFQRPLAIAHAPGNADSLYVTEQGGRILIVRNGVVSSQPFLDISERVRCCGERGLLSIAFHPLFQSNGQFFINYTANDGSTVVSRFVTQPGDPTRADALSEEVILTIAQPFQNHNGGQLQFGPDGYLYIGTGDGGAAGDPDNRSQNGRDLLGKMLRIDIDGAAPYAIPPDNPFVGTSQTLDEIWALGLRNPWRFSFDRTTGDLFIADVGQNRIEEIDYQPATSGGGENYGWRVMEGTDCFNPSNGCNRTGLTLPILEYSHNEGCSVTGGHVYRGTSRRLQGYYFYGDFCSGTIWGALQVNGVWTNIFEVRTSLAVSAFGEDLAGNVYVLDYNGVLYRIDDQFPTRRRPARR